MFNTWDTQFDYEIIYDSTYKLVLRFEHETMGRWRLSNPHADTRHHPSDSARLLCVQNRLHHDSIVISLKYIPRVYLITVSKVSRIICWALIASSLLERVYRSDTANIRLGARQPPAAAATRRLQTCWCPLPVAVASAHHQTPFIRLDKKCTLLYEMTGSFGQPSSSR